MVYHHTKNKGDLGVLKTKADLCQKGFLILSPETEHAPFDLVAYKNKFYRVQVKARSISKNGALKFKFISSWVDKNGLHTKPVNKSEIDVYSIYCLDNDNCYYLNPKDFNTKEVTLRVSPPKNKQKSNIRLIDDYLKFPL